MSPKFLDDLETLHYSNWLLVFSPIQIDFMLKFWKLHSKQIRNTVKENFIMEQSYLNNALISAWVNQFLSLLQETVMVKHGPQRRARGITKVADLHVK